jgi:D-alanine-D-alanine ligase
MKWVVWYPEPEGSGRADEIDSVQQAAAVAAALRQRRTAAQLMPLRAGDLDRSIAALRAAKPDAVFNLIEEVDGNAGLNLMGPAVLEVLGLPFTGSAADVIAFTTDKPATKVMLRSAGLPTPDWIVDDRSEVGDPSGPFLLKPARTDASIGIDEGQLVLEPGARRAREALDRLNGDRSVWMAERYVAGREFNLSILEIDGVPTVLPVPEMRFIDYPRGKPKVVGYRAKWDPNSFEYHHMERVFELPESDRALVAELGAIALQSWRLLRLSGYARVDFRVDEQGRPWVLEVNANPGIAPDAGFAAAAKRAGMSYPDAIGRVAAAARVHGRRSPIVEVVPA